jgi:hypothetical protein
MKPCCDCVHFRQAESIGSQPWCNRFAKEFVGSTDIVNGPTIQRSAPDCRVARGEHGQCGEKGRSFMAREGTRTWLQELREQSQPRIVKPPRKKRPWWRFW